MKTSDQLAEEHLLSELSKAPARAHQHLMTDFKAGYNAAMENSPFTEKLREVQKEIERKDPETYHWSKEWVAIYEVLKLAGEQK